MHTSYPDPSCQDIPCQLSMPFLFLYLNVLSHVIWYIWYIWKIENFLSFTSSLWFISSQINFNGAVGGPFSWYIGFISTYALSTHTFSTHAKFFKSTHLIISLNILWPKIAGFGFMIINWLPSPTQTKPSPLNPSLHSHVYDPGVFVHVATAWHWWEPFPWHSSTSWHSTPSPTKPVRHLKCCSLVCLPGNPYLTLKRAFGINALSKFITVAQISFTFVDILTLKTITFESSITFAIIWPWFVYASCILVTFIVVFAE